MEKRALGRGLSALIAETRDDENVAQVRDVPLRQIIPNPYQPRTLFDPLKMEELVSSVREHGVLQPVLVRRSGLDQYQLIAGERRFRAAQSAGLTAIPALIREMDQKEQLEVAVVENLQREDIGALEAARAYRRLMDEFSMTQEVVSQRVGKSRSAVANTLRLLHLPELVQESVERGEITEGHARALLSVEGEVAILKAWEAVVRRSLSVRDTEKLAKETKQVPSTPTNLSSAKEASPRREDPHVSDLVSRLQESLGTKVSLRRNGSGSGKIEIDFYSESDLERIADTLLH
ncbi:MAG: ParB/RepB/Spo0J family partition protein [Chthonomonadaceae bacterium]|nr:ParB/RepB/Spo0J family partition protein [Chthonomonadaceae bacterium]